MCGCMPRVANQQTKPGPCDVVEIGTTTPLTSTEILKTPEKPSTPRSMPQKTVKFSVCDYSLD